MRSFDATTETYKSSNEELTNAEFNILIEHKDIVIKSLISKLDDLQEEQKDERNFCANYRKKHFLGKCLLSSMKVCKICEEAHQTEHCPSLPRLRKLLRKSSKESNQPPGITQSPSSFSTWINAYSHEKVSQHVYNSVASWKILVLLQLNTLLHGRSGPLPGPHP